MSSLKENLPRDDRSATNGSNDGGRNDSGSNDSGRVGRGAWAAAIAASVPVFAFLTWLLYGRDAGDSGGDVRSVLPALNAVFNSLCALCLVAGVRAVRSGRRQEHARWMIAALCMSGLFLVSYVTHHTLHGDTPFPGVGSARVVYLSILASHVLATMVALPMILLTVFYAATGRFEAHRPLARKTFPLWLYVSVTGVLIFAFLEAYL